MSHDLARMRHEYANAELRRDDLAANPIEQFEAWFDAACRADVIEPNAMSLATVDAQGRPSLRTVLLKQFDARGFVLFTNYESRKASEIAVNPNVALLFPWLKLGRQVIVSGAAERIPAAETLAYFVRRPVEAQVAAWTSQQSRVISSRSLLEAKWAELKQKFAAGDVPVPSFWGGLRVVPRTLEFWQGRPNRLHDRFLYTLESDRTWRIERLAP